MSALVSLAADINREHHAAFCKAREALEHARRAGELLIEAKATVRHGEWLPWLSANVQFSERTAQGYMRLAAHWPELEAKSATVADLPLRDALKALAEPDDHHTMAPPDLPAPAIGAFDELLAAADQCGAHVELIERESPDKNDARRTSDNPFELVALIRDVSEWLVEYALAQRALCTALIAVFEHPDAPAVLEGKPKKYAIKDAYRWRAQWTESWIEHSEHLRDLQTEVAA